MKKNPWRYYHFTQVYHKWQSYDAWFLRYWARETGSFWTIFCPYTPLTTQKIRILKSEKKAWRYCHFTNVHNKWQSNDVWFLRYEAWRTEFFVLLDRFLFFYPPNNPKKSQFWKTETNTWRNHHFIPNIMIKNVIYQKSWSYAILFLRYSA